MTRGDPRRPAKTVVLLYGYAANRSDAVSRVITELAEGLRSQGVPTVVLGIKPMRLQPAQGSLLTKVLRLTSEAAYLLSVSSYLFRRRRSVHAVISVDVPSGLPFVGAMLRRVTHGRIRDIAWVMDLYRIARPQELGLVSRLRARLELAALTRAAHVVTIGECMTKTLAAHDLTPVTIPLWHAEMPITATQESDGSGQRDLRLLYSGSARDIHPLSALGRTLGSPSLDFPWSFRVVGSGPGIDDLPGSLNARASERVTFPPRASTTGWAENAVWADVHVVSLAESATGTCVPSKTYAAMAAGKAVLFLGSEEGQAAKDVIAAECGLVVPTSDTNAILHALSRLADPTFLARCQENARTFYDAHRTVSRGVDSWRGFLDELGSRGDVRDLRQGEGQA